MDAEERLRKTVRWRTVKRPAATPTLGSVAEQLLHQQIEPRHSRCDGVVETFEELLPESLSEHCRIDNILRGRMKVLVDSPVYIHELRLCKHQLLAELRHRCPRARIKDIKLTIGNINR